MPGACVLAQSMAQFTPPGQELKYMNTAPSSRLPLRRHGAVSGTWSTHGSEYAKVHFRPAWAHSVRAASIRRTHSTLFSLVAQSVTRAWVGSLPAIWQCAARTNASALLPRFTSMGPSARMHGPAYSARSLKTGSGSGAAVGAFGVADAASRFVGQVGQLLGDPCAAGAQAPRTVTNASR